MACLVLAAVTAQPDCPVLDVRCSCEITFYDNSINCRGLGNVDDIPRFNSSNLKFEALEISQHTAIRTVQALAFSGLRVRKVLLPGLTILFISIDAFVGLDTSYLEEIHIDDNAISTIPAGECCVVIKIQVLKMKYVFKIHLMYFVFSILLTEQQ